jgi:hypothetical protein
LLDVDAIHSTKKCGFYIVGENGFVKRKKIVNKMQRRIRSILQDRIDMDADQGGVLVGGGGYGLPSQRRLRQIYEAQIRNGPTLPLGGVEVGGDGRSGSRHNAYLNYKRVQYMKAQKAGKKPPSQALILKRYRALSDATKAKYAKMSIRLKPRPRTVAQRGKPRPRTVAQRGNPKAHAKRVGTAKKLTAWQRHVRAVKKETGLSLPEASKLASKTWTKKGTTKRTPRKRGPSKKKRVLNRGMDLSSTVYKGPLGYYDGPRDISSTVYKGSLGFYDPINTFARGPHGETVPATVSVAYPEEEDYSEYEGPFGYYSEPSAPYFESKKKN